MDFTQDLAATLADFGQSVTVGGVSCKAIFDNGAALGAVGPIGMASTQPTLTLRTADLPASPVGLNAVVDSTTWLVATHDSDGTGISTLQLEASA